MPDANKTKATRELTKSVSSWLNEKGFKPIETEASVSRGWVADLASVICPTRTEAQNLKLINRKPKWGAGSSRCRRAVAWEKTYHALPDTITAIVEIKTTVADFRQDQRKFKRPPPAHLMYLAVPGGMLDASAIENNAWGLLYVSAEHCRCVHQPRLRTEISPEQVLRVVYEIGIRRDHFTRYARFREFDDQARQTDNDRINRTRVADAVRMVQSIVAGERTVLEAIAYYLPQRTKLAGRLIDELTALAPGPGFRCGICDTVWTEQRPDCPVCGASEIISK